MSELLKLLSLQESRDKFCDIARLIPQTPSRPSKEKSVRLDARKSAPREASAGIAIPDGGLPAARLKRVLAFIDGHLDENITLADLARSANLSVYYFATLFRKSTGFSPHRYILNRRVSRARELLRNTGRSVLDVSLDLGFQHQNNFARAFRRITGMTPTGFRRSNPSR
jgi:AraC family transcriptional regulator